MTQLVEKAFFSTALAASADRYNGDPATDVYNMALYNHIAFIIYHGTGATGTVVVTVEACSSIAGANPEAVAFRYAVGTAAGVLGAQQAATASGFTIAAGSDQLAVVEIEDTELVAGKPFVRMQLTEGVDSPVLGAVGALLTPASYSEDVMPNPTV